MFYCVATPWPHYLVKEDTRADENLPPRRCSESFARRVLGVWQLNSHQYGNMVRADKKKMFTHNRDIYSSCDWLKSTQPPSRESCVFSLHAQKFTFYFFFLSLPLNATCAGTPAFQLVADVVSARNIRSLRRFPHFNYNATWRTELLVSKGLTGKRKCATPALVSARRRRRAAAPRRGRQPTRVPRFRDNNGRVRCFFMLLSSRRVSATLL